MLLVFCSGACFAQSELDVQVEVQPYNTTIYFKKDLGKPVKQLICIRAKGGDTVYTDSYDTLGNRVKHIQYTYGKKTAEDVFQTLPLLHVWQWQETKWGKDKPNYSSKTTNNASGQPLLYENASLVNNDTTSRQIAKFTYNAAGQLTNRDEFFNGNPTLSKSYQYSGKDMVIAEIKNHTTNNDNFRRIEYSYNADHLPLEKKVSEVSDGTVSQYAYDHYTYNNGKLVSEKYSDSSDPKKEIVIKYTYDINNRPETINVSEDTLYRNITYTFKDSMLTKIAVKSNAWNKFNREIFFSVTNPLTPIPFLYEREYIYDTKKNLIQTKESINGEFKAGITYIIEYYK